jgi:hypothetical protein
LSKYLTTVCNAFEADMVRSRLADAGIHAIPHGTLVPKRSVFDRLLGRAEATPPRKATVTEQVCASSHKSSWPRG